MPSKQNLYLGIGVLMGLLLSAFALAKAPYEAADNTCIRVSGTMASINDDSFVLDYGEGTMTVEMEDSARFASGYKLQLNSSVTVYGCLDDELFDNATIEADSVYVEEAGVYYHADPADEEKDFVSVHTPVEVAETELQGTVTNIRGDAFMIDTGERQVQVMVDAMPYNPLDEQGARQIEEGDRVSVTGYINKAFLEEQKMMANSAVVLTD